MISALLCVTLDGQIGGGGFLWWMLLNGWLALQRQNGSHKENARGPPSRIFREGEGAPRAFSLFEPTKLAYSKTRLKHISAPNLVKVKALLAPRHNGVLLLVTAT